MNESRVPADLTAALRTEVGRFRQEEQRRLFPPRLALGHLGAPATSVSGPVAPWAGPPWPAPRWLDHGTRFEVVDRLAGAWPAGTDLDLWLLRPGRPVLHDEDRAWHAASRHAVAAHGLVLRGFWVVTRYGWLEPVSGEARAWKRLRIDR